ncbi:MAG: hypothetical protein QM516_05775 [Limnohabitans sp.]|nr:hypothetical protein [Limnohabitans sp.]
MLLETRVLEAVLFDVLELVGVVVVIVVVIVVGNGIGFVPESRPPVFAPDIGAALVELTGELFFPLCTVVWLAT